MKATHIALCALTLTALAATSLSAQAAANATKPEAVAMVKKGVAFIKANGTAKGYAAVLRAFTAGSQLSTNPGV